MTLDEAQWEYDTREHPSFDDELDDGCLRCGNDFDDCECEE